MMNLDYGCSCKAAIITHPLSKEYLEQKEQESLNKKEDAETIHAHNHFDGINKLIKAMWRQEDKGNAQQANRAHKYLEKAHQNYDTDFFQNTWHI